MAGQSGGRPVRRPSSTTPAERSVEFTNTQRRLKQEAADRREAAKDGPEAQAPAPDAEPADGQGPDQPGG